MMQLQLKASLKKNINNNNNNGDASSVSLSAQRQLEALFNLTQLLFGLSRAETVNFTFRDLQFKKHPHSFKRSGFKKLKTGYYFLIKMIPFKIYFIYIPTVAFLKMVESISMLCSKSSFEILSNKAAWKWPS